MERKIDGDKIEEARANLARSKLWLQQVKSDLEKYKSN